MGGGALPGVALGDGVGRRALTRGGLDEFRGIAVLLASPSSLR